MATDRPPSIEVRDLSKSYGHGPHRIEALVDLNLRVEAGRTTALVGPSGCGKSTLLRLVAGLETPTSGSLRIGDETPEAVRARGDLAVAFQDAALLPWRSVRGNVALGRALAGLQRDRTAVDALIALVGLSGFEERRPAELSGGMRQRVAIARALAGRPRLLLLDEPFGAVDELTRGQLHQDLAPLWQAQGTTTLLVTHSVAEAVRLSDRVVVLTPRPARVAADIAIDLPWPRGTGIGSNRFHAFCDEVSAALRDSGGDQRLAAQ
ncbi:ABC transporter ATP-binding protein [Rubellimicrobium arenae]|uniref:ABC transporter ATP-binding protein n=1 Tax=Rubellimicrobium arenae TaxID=2817372 RepID=UPI001B30B783|nr:ABC transporter ATP-binding protein [Rubellimicrobium arenae]